MEHVGSDIGRIERRGVSMLYRSKVVDTYSIGDEITFEIELLFSEDVVEELLNQIKDNPLFENGGSFITRVVLSNSGFSVISSAVKYVVNGYKLILKHKLDELDEKDIITECLRHIGYALEDFE